MRTENTPRRVRFDIRDNTNLLHYTQKFSLQQKKIDKLLRPILFTKTKITPAPPAPVVSKKFRAYSVPKQRASPYQFEDGITKKKVDQADLYRKVSSYDISSEQFQVELTPRPIQLRKPRKLSPIDGNKLKSELLEGRFSKLNDL